MKPTEKQALNDISCVNCMNNNAILCGIKSNRFMDCASNGYKYFKPIKPEQPQKVCNHVRGSSRAMIDNVEHWQCLKCKEWLKLEPEQPQETKPEDCCKRECLKLLTYLEDRGLIHVAESCQKMELRDFLYNKFKNQ